MRIILLIALSILAFGASFVGVYMSIEPPAQSDLVVPDSLDVGALTDSLGREAWGASLEAQSTLVASLVDSLAVSRSRTLAAQNRIEDLLEDIDELEKAATARQSRQEIATAMASTLPKLEQKELTPILDGLDDASLDDLYNAASARNRTSILQALPPERASALVERQIAPPGRRQVAPADTTTSQI